MTKRINLDKIRLLLAISSLFFALFNCGYSYGFMLVERYREFYPPEIRFGSYSDWCFDIMLRYFIISGCYMLYILFIRREKTIINQAIGLLLLLIILYQTGVYSFIMIPAVNLQWAEKVLSPTFINIVNYLQIFFGSIGIVLLTILQFVSVWQTYKSKDEEQKLSLN